MKKSTGLAGLIIGLIATSLMFENCGGTKPADQSILATAGNLAGITGYPGGSGAYAGPTPPPQDRALALQYAPVPAGTPVTITVDGGTPPITYKLAKGAGTLVGNVYQTPLLTEVASIIAYDSLGEEVVIALPVIPVSNEAYTALPNGKAVMRNCGPGTTLESFKTQKQNAATLIAYDYCLLLSRAATSAEVSKYSNSINGGNLSPYKAFEKIMGLPEFEATYSADAAPDANLVTLAFHTALFRDPTSTEQAALTTITTMTFPDAMKAIFNEMKNASDWETTQAPEKSGENKYISAGGSP